MIHTLWLLYAQLVGIAAIAAAISFGVIRLPVERGAGRRGGQPRSADQHQDPLWRHAGLWGVHAAPGVLRGQRHLYVHPPFSQSQRRHLPAGSITGDQADDRAASLRIELPDNVYPGPWRFQSIVDSQCPTYSRQDVIAAFDIEVLDPEGE